MSVCPTGGFSRKKKGRTSFASKQKRALFANNLPVQKKKGGVSTNTKGAAWLGRGVRNSPPEMLHTLRHNGQSRTEKKKKEDYPQKVHRGERKVEIGMIYRPTGAHWEGRRLGQVGR